MRRVSNPLLAVFLVTFGGSQASAGGVTPCLVEVNGKGVASSRVTLAFAPCADDVPASGQPSFLDLSGLWNLALANNPALREAEAEVEAARGRLLQARKYPNPTVAYSEESVGAKVNPAGALRLEVTQEVLTAHKRPLDIAVNVRGLDVFSLALLGQRFTVLTNIRSAYFDYLGWAYTVRLNGEFVARLEQDLQITRKLVEEAQTRPRTDLLQAEGLLAQARLDLTNSRTSRGVAWRQLGTRVGVPYLPMPATPGRLPETVPTWTADAVQRRVLAANTTLKQAVVQADQARLRVERAKAEAVPNVTVGGGYTHSFTDPEGESGAIVSVQAPLPFWDRKQGLIHEAEANWIKAQAAVDTTAAQLSFDTAAAFGRYESARQQVMQLTADILPRLQQSLDLLRQGYQRGATGVAFTDLLLAEQTLFTSRLTLASARRSLWLAIAELEGLMQLDLGGEFDIQGPSCH